MNDRSSTPVTLEYTMLFGKHKGKTIEYILENDPSYVVWLAEEKILKIPDEIYQTAQEYDAEEDDWHDWDWGDLNNDRFWGLDFGGEDY